MIRLLRRFHDFVDWTAPLRVISPWIPVGITVLYSVPLLLLLLTTKGIKQERFLLMHVARILFNSTWCKRDIDLGFLFHTLTLLSLRCDQTGGLFEHSGLMLVLFLNTKYQTKFQDLLVTICAHLSFIKARINIWGVKPQEAISIKVPQLTCCFFFSCFLFASKSYFSIRAMSCIIFFYSLVNSVIVFLFSCYLAFKIYIL